MIHLSNGLTQLTRFVILYEGCLTLGCGLYKLDIRVWNQYDEGCFSVKSVVFLADDTRRKCLKHDGGAEANNSTCMQWWKNIWSLKLQNKVKNLVWRACKGILPTTFNFFKRKVSSNPICWEFRVCASSVRRNQRWLAPEIGFIKINVDAAFGTEEGKTLSGLVARDAFGRVLAAQSKLGDGLIARY